jgi:hypothetical protein
MRDIIRDFISEEETDQELQGVETGDIVSNVIGSTTTSSSSSLRSWFEDNLRKLKLPTYPITGGE